MSTFGLDQLEWNTLIDSLRAGECTPFLGGGAASSVFGSAKEVVTGLAPDAPDLLKAYPDDVPKIAQQLRARLGTTVPKRRMAQFLKTKANPLMKSPESPHSVLASLDFKVWITTAYDDLIERALVDRWKSPQVRLCKWSPFGVYQNQISVPSRDRKTSVPVEKPFSEAANATKATPLVYHLYGHYDWVQSLVVTEDDYFEFLANTAQHTDRIESEDDVGRISSCVGSTITNTSLLFLGYRLGDLDFRILLHSIKSKTRGNEAFNVAIQIQPDEPASEEMLQAVGEAPRPPNEMEPPKQATLNRLRRYAESDLQQYFPNAQIKVLFADCETFASALANACNPAAAAPQP